MELSQEEKLKCFVIPVSGAGQKYRSGRRRQRKWTLDKAATEEKLEDKKKAKFKEAVHKTKLKKSKAIEKKVNSRNTVASKPKSFSDLLITASQNLKPCVLPKDKPNPTKVTCTRKFPLKVPINSSSKINVLDSIFNAPPTVIDTSMSTSRY
jgi:hypothetical protein